MNQLNIVLCGIGGQGTVLASEIISGVYMKTDFDIKSTDIIGIGQRGGSVLSHIKTNHIVHSPLIKEKQADILIAFEKYEALRWAKYLKDDGLMIVNDLSITPNAVEMGLDIDVDIENELSTLNCSKLIVPNVHKYMNISILGAFSRFTTIPESVWIDTLRNSVRPNSLEINLEAFSLGRHESQNFSWRGNQ